MLSVKGDPGLFSNPNADRSSAYPDTLKLISSLEKASLAIGEIKRWPGYRRTPLYELDHLAHELNVARIWYKDESQRFGLKSFKALGGAYAVSRQLRSEIEKATGAVASLRELLSKKYLDIVSDILISCATDGNHGRSVAWGCQLFGCKCVVYIHRDVSPARQQAMENLGAEVIRIAGNYDDSVKQADAEACQHKRIIVSDTSYAGYMEIPKDVALGYTVLLAESVQQMKGDIPSHVFVQGGVGGLASAVCAYFWELWGAQRPRFIIVEPDNANCLQQSAQNEKPTVVAGKLDTLMAGLACGEVSVLAWEVLKTGVDGFMTINEGAVAPTMQLLAQGFAGDPGIEAGESAVAGMAALISARNNPALSRRLGLDETSRIYILGTEGATDPELYTKLLGE